MKRSFDRELAYNAMRGSFLLYGDANMTPQNVLDMIPDIVDTCRACRAWQKPGPDVTPSVELVTRRNEQVEADSLFFHRFSKLAHDRPRR